MVKAHLYILRPHCGHACDAQHKTYRIEDIGLPTPIEARDRIKALVPPADDGPHSIGLEAIDHQFNDPHFGVVVAYEDLANTLLLIIGVG